MGTPRTVKRRRQRQAARVERRRVQAAWDALSPAQQAERRQQAARFDVLNAVVLETLRPSIEAMFTQDTPFFQRLKAR